MVSGFWGVRLSYLSGYLQRISAQGNASLATSIRDTVDRIVPEYIGQFSFTEHVVSLLVGDVQSGKTSQMFGLICAAADEGFMNFVLLTSDNVLLHQQTCERAKRDLCEFCICDENDYVKYVDNDLRKPAVVILKKNSSILRKWRDNFVSSKLCIGNPVFMVDDEADSASLNTRVNAGTKSAVNERIDSIRRLTTSSIYLQVTGTPQALILQTNESGWKPYFIHYFEPGERYIGGGFLFSCDASRHIVLTDDEEADGLREDDEFPENRLKEALLTHLISSAHIMLKGGEVSNFLIHPSVRIADHRLFANKIGNYLNEIALSAEEVNTRESFLRVYQRLRETKSDLVLFDSAYECVVTRILSGEVKVLVLNSESSYDPTQSYDKGVNIIVGGNSLGRGVTIPRLQTMYYCRLSSSPQADTIWQHSRMFGYDRDLGLLRVFMPPRLFKLFKEIYRTNCAIINQIKKASDWSDIKVVFPDGIKPTRSEVIDRKNVSVYGGGVNYFPFDPVNVNVDKLDSMLESFSGGPAKVSLRLIMRILELVGSGTSGDWNVDAFRGFVKSFVAESPGVQGVLIVRRGRDIGRGTGTLLSPSDRALGDDYPDQIVLTLYKITGTLEKGWSGERIWIPNIKLPCGRVYYA